jgi:hypothetical protein
MATLAAPVDFVAATPLPAPLVLPLAPDPPPCRPTVLRI